MATLKFNYAIRETNFLFSGSWWVVSSNFAFVVAISQLTGEFESFHNTQNLSQTTYKCKKCRYIFLVQCCQYLFHCQPQWVSGWQFIVKLTNSVVNKEFLWCTSMIPVMIQKLALRSHVWNEKISAVFNSWMSQKRSGFLWLLTFLFRRLLFTEGQVIPHTEGGGEATFLRPWEKHRHTSTADSSQCVSSLFVEPVQWMLRLGLHEIQGKVSHLCPL